MADVAGKVVSVQGEVLAVDPKTGATRVLHAGDQVFVGELITTAKGATVDLSLSDGRTQEVLDNKKVLLQSEVAAGAGNVPTSSDSALHPPTGSNSPLSPLQVGSTLESVIQGNGFLASSSESSSFSSTPVSNTFHSSGVNVAAPGSGGGFTPTDSIAQTSGSSIPQSSGSLQPGSGQGPTPPSQPQNQNQPATQQSGPVIATQDPGILGSQGAQTAAAAAAAAAVAAAQAKQDQAAIQAAQAAATSSAAQAAVDAAAAQRAADAAAHSADAASQALAVTVQNGIPSAISEAKAAATAAASDAATAQAAANTAAIAAAQAATSANQALQATDPGAAKSAAASAGTAEAAASAASQAAATSSAQAATDANAAQQASHELPPQITVSLPSTVSWTDEAGSVTVSGQVTGTFKAGDTVTLTVGGHSFSTSVDANGHYSTSIPGSALVGGSSLQAVIAAHDPSGNVLTASAGASYTADVPVAISVNMPGVVSWTEEAGSVAVNGQVTGTFRAGDTVTLNVGGSSFSGSVDAAGHYSIAVPGAVLVGNTSVQATIQAHDASGNSQSASASASYLADTTPTVSVNMPSVVTWSDEAGNVTVSGQVTGTFQAGDTVTLTVGSNTFTASVNAQGHYSLDIPGQAFVGNTNIQATLLAHDTQGNSQTVTAAASFVADPSVSITVSAPDVTWANEVPGGTGTGTVTLSGTTTGAQQGNTVTVTLGDGQT
ncbi:MAG: Ig-like domain-containing protein, partial [Betaproteobacteria bacterium]|nr:Ig-like domain-containing protein [Betaproteobacteria bacterium]